MIQSQHQTTGWVIWINSTVLSFVSKHTKIQSKNLHPWEIYTKVVLVCGCLFFWLLGQIVFSYTDLCVVLLTEAFWFVNGQTGARSYLNVEIMCSLK